MASDELIDAYLERVAIRTGDAMSEIALAQFEQVTIAFEIAPNGSPSKLTVLSASNPAAAEAAQLAVREAAPYPPPPFDMKACLIGGRAEVMLYSSGKCDERQAEEYLDKAVNAVRMAVERDPLAAKYDGDVVLRIDVARDGGIESVTVQKADSEQAGAAVAAAARSVARFDPPGELVRDCVADGPLLVWVPLSELPTH